MGRRLFHAILWLPLVALVGLASAAPAPGKGAAGASAAGIAYFETHIRPLLAARCYACHSTRASKVQGGLLLDTRASWQRGGASGPAIVPGDPDKSPLIQAVRYSGRIKMPPGGKLAEREVAALVEWVKMGAPDPREGGGGPVARKSIPIEEGRKRWAFLPPHPVAVPVVREAAWCRTPVDRFIRAKQDEKGLRPSPAADRRTLIRRAYFDLLGLPPTPQEVEAFVNDRSSDAWEQVIDHLLASPHYGERWGRHWLDLARFAESHGYEQDYDRPNAYHYRDFVIKALNADMPYDRFVRWQIAGDGCSPDDPLALMATGFLAAGTHATQITKNQVEKERYDELDDMLSTIGTSMLGLTLGCARCHDHKFDPVPNQDYYRLLSTFTTTVRSDYPVDMDPKGYGEAKAHFDAEHTPLLAAEQKWEAERLVGRLDEWLRHRSAGDTAAWRVLQLSDPKSAGGATLTDLGDGSLLVGGKNPDTETFTFTATTALSRITAFRLEALAHPTLVRGGPGRAANGNFALTDFRVQAAPKNGSGQPVPVKMVRARATFEQAGLPVRAAIDGDPKSGWAVDPQFGKDHAAVFEPETPVGFEGGTVLTFTLKFETNTGHSIAQPRLSVTSGDGTVAFEAPARPEAVEQVLAALPPPFFSSVTQREVLQKWYRTQDPEWQQLEARIQEHLAHAPKPNLVTALISSEGVPAVRTHTQGGDFLDATHFLKRGDPNQKLGVATQGFLQVLVRAPEAEKRWQEAPPAGWRTSYRRRSLANWITDPDQGAGFLLARVIVNRLWQHHFGRGIVGTPSDFGAQGEPPSHPELLDWLAGELIRGGWKLKPIHKLLMISAVYAQSSRVDPSRAKLDPDNRLWVRQSRRRLEAEVIRDAMLSVSGELDERMFGPGTLEETKRRSIYFFVKRSRLVPTLQVFDAPDTLQGLPVRAATIVAPQALLLLNSPQVREYSHALARRLQAPGQGVDGSTEGMVRSGYLLTLSRPPTPHELADSLAFVDAQAKSHRAADPKLEQGAAEERAVTDFCQVLLGLNEFIYVD